MWTYIEIDKLTFGIRAERPSSNASCLLDLTSNPIVSPSSSKSGVGGNGAGTNYLYAASSDRLFMSVPAMFCITFHLENKASNNQDAVERKILRQR
ncbi:MAG: hypothetical protein LBU32_02345 [Clostridiales bacterium]|nr:hypothetical protein [Clostridiales bacterium]